MEPGATEKGTVTVWGRRRPSVANMPRPPPGMTRFSLVPGTKGPDAENCRTSGVIRYQLPATGGEKVGRGLAAASGVDSSTVTVALEATPLAPAVGEVPSTDSGSTTGLGLAPASDDGPSTCEWSARSTPPEATATRATQSAAISQTSVPLQGLGFACLPIDPSDPGSLILPGRIGGDGQPTAARSVRSTRPMAAGSVSLAPAASRT